MVTAAAAVTPFWDALLAALVLVVPFAALVLLLLLAGHLLRWGWRGRR